MFALTEDFRRIAGAESPLTISRCVRLFLRNYGIQALVAYRLGQSLVRASRAPYLWPLLPVGWPIYFILSRCVRFAFDIRLHLSADIGPGLYIGHFGNIVVRKCVVGARCSISQSTHLEPAADGEVGPSVGNRVWIGAHARVVGPFCIGDNATISAAAVVRRDIPAGALCLGDPARVVAIDYDNSKMIS